MLSRTPDDARMSYWQRGGHPLARLHRMLPATALPLGVMAWFDPVQNIQFINKDAFETLSEFQQDAIYRREETILAEDATLADVAHYVLG